jgi:hypothetical protein
MIHAVNANFQPRFTEGSALAACTQKLWDLVTKIRDFFMKIFQTILPCVFGKPDRVAVAVTPIPPSQTADNVVAAAIPVVLSAAEPQAVLAQVEEPAAEPIAPAAVQELPPVVLADVFPMPEAPGVVLDDLEEPESPTSPHSPVLQIIHRSSSAGPLKTDDNNRDPIEFKESFVKRVLENARRPPTRRGNLSTRGAERGNRQRAPAAAAAPETENRVLGTGGLNQENSKAGPIVCLDVLVDLWDKIFNPAQISGALLDGLIARGIMTYGECREELDEGRVSVNELIIQNRDVQAVPIGLQEGSIQEVLANLQVAKQGRPLLGALLTRNDQTYGIFICSAGPEEANRFIVLDPHEMISFESFENMEAVADYLLRNQGDKNEFSVVAFERQEQLSPSLEEDDIVYVRHGTLTEEEARALRKAEEEARAQRKAAEQHVLDFGDE